MVMPTLTSAPLDARPSPPPTPPARVLPMGVIAAVCALVALTCTVLALRSVHRLVEMPTTLLTTVLLLVAVAAAVPLVPAVRALLLVPRRSALAAAGNLSEARQAAARGRELAATAMGYALATLLVAGVLGFTIANNGAIATTFLRWEFIEASWEGVAKAFAVNVQVAVGAQVLVLIVGLALAVMRLLPGRAGRPLRWIATLYVDVFRAIPSIIVLYLVGFGLSLAQVPIVRDFSPLWLAILALTLTYSAYVAEVYRADIDSIHPSQWSASRSLGLSYSMTLRTVIVPQAVRRITPPLLNDFIGLQKDTALIGVMGVTDAFMQARLVSSNVFNLTPVIVVAVLFVIITIPQARFVDRLIAGEQARRAGRTS